MLSPEELRALFTPEEDKPKMYAIALYDFEAQNKRELSFSKVGMYVAHTVLNTIHPIENSLKKQKSCTKV